MSRLGIVLTALLALLLVALFWFLLWTPAQEDLEEIEAAIEAEEATQDTLRASIESLRAVRQEAPEAEARLSTASTIVTRDPALPSALRQLQSAADESGLTLRSVNTSPPASLDAELNLANIALTVQVEGSYFQVVDYLRRVEEPRITPRGIRWSNLSVSISEYPGLGVTLSGNMYTLLPEEEIVDDPDEADDPDAIDDDANGAEQDELLDPEDT